MRGTSGIEYQLRRLVCEPRDESRFQRLCVCLPPIFPGRCPWAGMRPIFGLKTERGCKEPPGLKIYGHFLGIVCRLWQD